MSKKRHLQLNDPHRLTPPKTISYAIIDTYLTRMYTIECVKQAINVKVNPRLRKLISELYNLITSFMAQVYKIISVVLSILKFSIIKNTFESIATALNQHKYQLLHALLFIGAVNSAGKLISHKKYTFSLPRSILKLLAAVTTISLLITASLTSIPTLNLLIANFAIELITYTLRFTHTLYKKSLVEKYSAMRENSDKTTFLDSQIRQGHSAYALHKLFGDATLIRERIRNTTYLTEENKKCLISQLPTIDTPNTREAYIKMKNDRLYKKTRKFTIAAILFALELAVLFTTGGYAAGYSIAVLVVSMTGKVWDCVVSNPFTSVWNQIKKLSNLVSSCWNQRKINIQPVASTICPDTFDEITPMIKNNEDNDLLFSTQPTSLESVPTGSL